jgi:hypothetical protein
MDMDSIDIAMQGRTLQPPPRVVKRQNAALGLRRGHQPLTTLSGRRWCYDNARAHELKCTLPYVLWITRNNRVVLANRYYEPIWSKSPGQPAVRADPCEWIKGILTQRYFYGSGDRSAPWHNKDTEQSLKVLLEMFRDARA